METVEPQQRTFRPVFAILAAAMLGYFLFILTYNLTDFTGLHVDEAWMGLNALSINEGGLQSLHGMNTYTGSLFSVLLAEVFKSIGVSVFSLRLPGAIANFIGALVLAFIAHRHRGERGFWTLAVLLLAFPGIFAFARVAWEVTAFHLLFVSLQLLVLSELIFKGRLGGSWAALYFFVTCLGVYNHFIFISLSVALVMSVLVIDIVFMRKTASLELSDQRLRDTLYHLNLLTVLGIAVCGFLFLVKPRLGDVFFQSYGWVNLVLLALPGVLAQIAYLQLIRTRARQSIGSFLLNRWSAVVRYATHPVVLIALAVPLLILLGIFVWRYFWVFLGTVTSVLPVQRIFVYEIPWVPFAIMHIPWLILIALFVWGLVRRGVQAYEALDQDFCKIVFYLLPLFAIMILAVFSWRTSSRHFLISCCLFVGVLPLVAPELVTAHAQKLKVVIASALVGAILCGHWIFYLALSSNIAQVPFLVVYPAHEDKSKHFLKQTEILSWLRQRQICEFGKTDNYISAPLKFYHRAEQYPCDRSKLAIFEYCLTCTEPLRYHSVQLK